MKFAALGPEQQTADYATDQRTADSEQRRHPEAHRDGAGIEEAREDTYNKTDDDHPDDAEDAHARSSTECPPEARRRS